MITLDIPNFDLPDFNLPNFDLPNFEMPDYASKLQSLYDNSALRQLEAMTQHITDIGYDGLGSIKTFTKALNALQPLKDSFNAVSTTVMPDVADILKTVGTQALPINIMSSGLSSALSRWDNICSQMETATRTLYEDETIRDRLYTLLEEMEDAIPLDDNSKSIFHDMKSRLRQLKVSKSEIISYITLVITLITFVRSLFPDPQLQEQKKTNEFLQQQNEQLQHIINLQERYADILQDIEDIPDDNIQSEDELI